MLLCTAIDFAFVCLNRYFRFACKVFSFSKNPCSVTYWYDTLKDNLSTQLVKALIHASQNVSPLFDKIYAGNFFVNQWSLFTNDVLNQNSLLQLNNCFLIYHWQFLFILIDHIWANFMTVFKSFREWMSKYSPHQSIGWRNENMS